MLNIVGIDKIKSQLSNYGVEVNPVDESIAEAIFNLTKDSTVVKSIDKDGFPDENAVAFIRNPQVEQLINSFPNAAYLLYFLNRKDNYGFVQENGEVKRTGVMGEYDPISAARDMVASYIGTQYEKNHLFDSIEQEQNWENWVRNKGIKYRDFAAYNANVHDTLHFDCEDLFNKANVK